MQIAPRSRGLAVSSAARRPFIGALGLACTVGVADSINCGVLAAGGSFGPQPFANIAPPSAHNFATLTHLPVAHTTNLLTVPALTTKSVDSLSVSGHTNSQSWAAASAASHAAASIFATTHGKSGKTLAGSTVLGAHDLDLTSTQANITASSLAGFHNLTIIVGGLKQVVALDSKLTGAEAVAAEQIIGGGSQTIKLAADGRASGGLITLNNSLVNALSTTLGGSINTLTIASGVKVIDSVSTFALTGNLDNYGSVLTASAVAHSSDTITADNIVNAAGGIIRNYSGAGLYSADPILTALTSLTNNGTIRSAGNLTINAPLVINGDASNNISNNAAVISAAKNININTVSLQNNAAITALNGAINIASNNANLSIVGGNLQAKQINLSAGTGNIDFNVSDADGTINADGDCIHITTASSQTLGNINASGDPQFVSTTGNVVIDGSITPTGGADLAFIAAGNVVSGAKGAIDTTTSTASGNGGNLTIIAGANFTGDDTSATVKDSTNAGKGSATGGIIDLTGKNGGTAAITEITTAGTGTGNAGYIEMIAYQGTATGSGTIILPTKVTLNAAGSGTGTNGNVTLIAGANTGTAITTGAIVGKQVTVLTETPSANGTTGIVFTDGTSNLGITGFTGTGSALASSVVLGALTTSNGLSVTAGGGVTTGQVTANGAASLSNGGKGGSGGTIAITAGGNINTLELDAFGAGGTGGGTGTVAGGAGGSGGIVTLNSGGNITVAGDINVSGGGGGGGAGGTYSTAAGAGGASGKAGSVTLTAPAITALIGISGEVLAYDGGAGGAGGIGSATGAGGGGGGGGSYGGAGGGGGGGADSTAGNSASGGGGGGSLLAPGGGGAGSAGGSGTVANGGIGGGYVALGAGGTFVGSGVAGSTAAGTRGGAGGKGGTLTGATGGLAPKGGGGGLSTVTTSTFKGTVGNQAAVVAGDGTLTIKTGGSAGTSKAALQFESGALLVSSPTVSGSAYLSDVSGGPLSVGAVSVGSGGTLSLTTSGNTATGVNNGTVTFLAAVSGGNLITNVAGNIATSGSGSLNVTTASLTATGTITAKTNLTNLTIVDKTDAVTITQGANTLNLIGASSLSTGSDIFQLTSVGSVNVIGTVAGGVNSIVDISVTGAANGISIANTLTAGSITLSTTGSANITSTSAGKLTAGFIALSSAGDIGSLAAPLTVNNNLAVGVGNELDVTVGSAGSVYVSDLGTTDLTLVPTNNSSGLLSVSSAATNLYVTQAPYANVNLTATSTAGIITLNSNSSDTVLIGNGNGAVTITAGSKILMNASNTGIEGTSVTLTANGGGIGLVTAPIAVTTANLTANAAHGSLYLTDSQTGVVNFTGSSLLTFNLTETGANSALIVNGAVKAQDITIFSLGSSGDIITNGPLGTSTASTNTIYVAPSGSLTLGGTATAGVINLGGFAGFGDGSPSTLGNIEIDGIVNAGTSMLIASPLGSGLTVNAALLGAQIGITSQNSGTAFNAIINAPIGNTGTTYLRINVSGDIITLPGINLTGGTVGLNAVNIGTIGTPVTSRTSNLIVNVTQDAYVNNTSAGPLGLSLDSKADTGTIVINNTGGGVNVSGQTIHDNITITGTGTINLGTSTDPSLVLTSGNILNLSGVGPINNFGQLSGGNVSFSGSVFSNLSADDGSGPSASSVSAGNSLTMTSPTGSLNLFGPAGSMTIADGGLLTLTAVGGITLGNSVDNPLANVAGGTLHAIVVNAGGPFSTNWNNLTVQPDSGGNGGVISITASFFTYLGSALRGAYPISASGSTGTGATVVFDLSSGTTLTIGGVKGNYNIDASGTNGATIDIETAGNLTANMSNLLYLGSGNGGAANLNLSAGAKLLINGDVDTHVGTGAYGSVILKSGSTTPFLVDDPTGKTTAGIINDTNSLGVRGSDVTITAGGGLVLSSGESIFASTGNISLFTPTLTNNGLIDTKNTLLISSAASIKFANAAASLGTLDAAMTGLDIVSSGGSIALPATLPTTISELTLAAVNGTITVPSTITGFSVKDSGGSGGSITFAASIVKATTPLTFNAAATANADNGGDIVFALTGTTALSIGASTYTFDVAKGSTATGGGSLSIANNGNLTVDASAAVLNLGSGTGTAGADLSLTAGSTAKGILLISNAVAFTNNTIADLALKTNSTTAFTLGGATAKTGGIVDGNLVISAESVAISNTGGGITQGTAGTLTTTSTTGGALVLSAGKGGIGTSHTSPLTVNTTNLAVTTADNAFIVNNNAAVTLDSLSAGKLFDYTSTGSIVAAARMTAPSLILDVNSINAGLSSNSATVSVTVATGNIAIGDGAAAITVNALTTGNGTVALNGNGSLKTLSTSIINGSSIDLGGGGTAGAVVIGKSLTATGDLTLTASGAKGTITAAKGVLLSGATMDLISSGGTIGGTHSSPLTIDTGSLTVNTGTSTTTASAFIKNSATSTTLGDSVVANVFDYTGALTGATGTAAAKSLLLAVTNFGATTFATTASSITATAATGNIKIADSQTGLLTLGTITDAAVGGTINISNGGAITAALTTAPGGISLTAGGLAGNVTLTKVLTASGGAVALAATGTGAIIASGGSLVGTTATLSTAGGGIGTSAKVLATTTDGLNITTGTTGDVYITNSDKVAAGVVNVSAANVGSLKLTETNSRAANTGVLNLSAITAGNGAITIATNEQTLNVNGSLLATTSGASTAGNITIQDTFTASGTNLPKISVANNLTIHADALVSTNLNAGNVYIVLGTLPTASTLKAGVTPSPAPTVTTSGSGAVTYGTTTNLAGSITTGTGDAFNALARNIVFNTGKNAATQISLGNNVTITADPPPASSASAISSTAITQNASQTTAASALTISTPVPITKSIDNLPISSGANNFSAALSDYAAIAGGANFSSTAPARLSQADQKGTTLTGEIALGKKHHESSPSIKRELESGPLFIAAEQNTNVTTPFGTVSIAKGAVVMIVVSRQGLAVYDLHDPHKNAVTLDCGQGLPLTLSPGRSLALTNNAVSDFAQINAIEQVAYRRLSKRQLDNQRQIFQADFDVLSLVRALAPLRQMLQDDTPAVRKTASSMVKTAAILAQIGSNEPYSYYSQPEMISANH